MKKSTIAVITLVAFMGVAMAFSMAWAQKTESGEVSDVITIHEEAFGKYKKGPVEFSHMKHSVDYKLACTECHHIYDGKTNTFKPGDKVQKCSACHELKKKGKVDKLEKAFHDNCKTCHKDFNKGGGDKKAPTSCKECHASK